MKLIIKTATARKWILRYTLHGQRKDMALGGYPLVDLDHARAAASKARKLVAEGRDPVSVRNEERGKAKTFREAFSEYFADIKKKLSNEKHKAQWESTMETYVFPDIGNDSIAKVTPKQVIKLLRPLWHSKPETASRVLQRMSVVFERAIVLEERKDANPCKGVATVLSKLEKDVAHHASLHYSKTPAFIQRLRKSNCKPLTKLAFEFMILTAGRSGQVRLAFADEIDPKTGLWTVPAKRMKSRREHVVPLPPRALQIYREARKLTGNIDLLFPSENGNPLSDMVFNKLLRDWGLADVAVAHGFRATFKTWCSEVDKVREVVSEAALAHVSKDKLQQAYQRGDFLEERTELMKRWDTFLYAPSKLTPDKATSSSNISGECRAPALSEMQTP